MKISFKKINKTLLFIQIAAGIITILLLLRSFKTLFTLFPGANVH